MTMVDFLKMHHLFVPRASHILIDSGYDVHLYISIATDPEPRWLLFLLRAEAPLSTSSNLFTGVINWEMSD